MHDRSPYVLAALLAAALLLTACGGGGTGSALPLPTASLGSTTVTGQVLDVDGLTTDLEGIKLSIAETGQTATTDADGAFDFGSVPAGTFTVQVDPSQWATRSPTLAGLSGGGHMGAEQDDGHSDYDADHSGYDDGMGMDMGDHGGYDDGMGHDDDQDDDAGMGMGEHDDWMDAEEHYHHGDTWHEDEFEDGEDSDVDDVVVHRAQDEEYIHLRLRIHEGMIGEMQCIRDTNMEREVERMMISTDANDDPDMHGKLELESRNDRERFKVRVEHVTPGRDLEVLVFNLEGVSESQGAHMALEDGSARWTLDTALGDRLPFGVDTVEELVGFRVEVRDVVSDIVLLYATASELPARQGPMGTPAEDTDDRGNGRDWMENHEDGVFGHVEMRHRSMMAEERVRIEVEGLEPGRELDCYFEDAEGSGLFEYVATIRANEHGVASFERNTGDGDDLPCGSDRVRDMEGHRVELRDPDSGDVILSGMMPRLVDER